MPKICIISDTHTYHARVNIPKGVDILVHCGDNTIYGEPWEFQNFLTWFGDQKPKHKIFVNGNHEVVVARQGQVKDMVRRHNANYFTNLHYLEESEVVVEGLKFWGSPKTPEFFDWAYMYKREDGERQWMGVPDDVDVLITHGPPAGVLDKVKPMGIYTREKAGCDDLLAKVKEVKPKLHCFGHIHYTYGWLKMANPAIPTLFVNAATCDSRYVPVHKPIVVDTDTWEVVEDV